MKMLQEAARDVLAQELIAGEVKKFMLKLGNVQEEDLSALEETIRQRLTGRTPPWVPILLVVQHLYRVEGSLQPCTLQ
jgi:hypothetical protein